MPHHTVGYGAIGSGSIPQNIAIHALGRHPQMTSQLIDVQASLQQSAANSKMIEPTALGVLQEKVATAVARTHGILNDAEAFANRVGVSRPPNDRLAPEPSHDPGSTAVTHMLHGAADELHRILSAIEDILGALRQHA